MATLDTKNIGACIIGYLIFKSCISFVDAIFIFFVKIKKILCVHNLLVQLKGKQNSAKRIVRNFTLSLDNDILAILTLIYD